MGQPNDAGELIQVISDSMLVIIPKYVDILGSCSRILTSTLALRIPMVVNLKERKSKEQLPDEATTIIPLSPEGSSPVQVQGRTESRLVCSTHLMRHSSFRAR